MTSKKVFRMSVDKLFKCFKKILPIPDTQITILTILHVITLLLYAHNKLKVFKLTRRFCLHNILLYIIKNQKVSKITHHRGNAPVNLEKPANFYEHKIIATACQLNSVNQKYSYRYNKKKLSLFIKLAQFNQKNY